MSLTLHFLRHLPPRSSLAGVLYGDEDIPLDETSDDVLVRLDELARILPLAKFHSSPVPRARKTAGHILHRQEGGHEVVNLLDVFAEQRFGDFCGNRHADLNETEHFKLFKADPVAYRPPNGESFKDCFERVSKGLSTMEGENGEHIIAAHGGVLRAVAARVLQLDLLVALKSFDVSPLAHLIVSYNKGYWHFNNLTQGAIKGPLTHPALI